MLYIDLSQVAAIADTKQFGSTVTRVYLHGGATIDVDKARGTKLLDKWILYCKEFPTHDAREVFTI